MSLDPEREERPSYLDRALTLQAHRNLRVQMFGESGSILHDAVWDILLCLFIRHEHAEATTPAELFTAANLPSSTGLRWLALLEREGLVCCALDTGVRSERLVGLSPRCHETMLRYLDSV